MLYLSQRRMNAADVNEVYTLVKAERPGKSRGQEILVQTGRLHRRPAGCGKRAAAFTLGEHFTLI